MAQVPDKVLSWLYTVLHEYNDLQRTYSDAARTLSEYPSLQTRTETYTNETGSSALLLILHGTLPVAFRGTTYRFPIKIWVPHAYPHEAPIAYVDPSKDMAVRPGQHVGVDGRIYHPYLRDWPRLWDRASIAEFVSLLRQVFAKEPPVISRAQQQQYQAPFVQGQQQMAGASQTPPQLPPKPGMQNPRPMDMARSSAPPVPPKPGEEYAELARDQVRDGPPLPPLPHEAMQTNYRTPSSNMAHSQWQTSRSPQPFVSASLNHQNGSSSGPSLLHQQVLQQQNFHQISDRDRSPVSPVSPANGCSELPESKYLQSPSQFQIRPPQASLNSSYSPRAQVLHQQAYQQPLPPSLPQPLHPSGYQNPQRYPPQRGGPSSHAAPDLLTDPFEIALPEPTKFHQAAPPIPPNPEKEHLLHAISGTLVQQAQQKVNQNLAAIHPLQAQHQALRAAHERLEGEIRQLDQLEQVLSSNEAILHRGIQECDHTITTAKSKKQPPIDEVLIAPTMVANQLWTLCAEEAACREAMYVLQKAVDRGRVSGNDFARHMRGLGRECFLKMALARKCARGMGLEMR